MLLLEFNHRTRSCYNWQVIMEFVHLIQMRGLRLREQQPQALLSPSAKESSDTQVSQLPSSLFLKKQKKVMIIFFLNIMHICFKNQIVPKAS